MVSYGGRGHCYRKKCQEDQNVQLLTCLRKLVVAHAMKMRRLSHMFESKFLGKSGSKEKASHKKGYSRLRDAKTDSSISTCSTNESNGNEIIALPRRPSDTTEILPKVSSGHRKVQKKELVAAHRERSCQLKEAKNLCSKLYIILQKLYDDTHTLQGWCVCCRLSTLQKTIEHSLNSYKILLAKLAGEESDEDDGDGQNLLGEKRGSAGTMNLMEKCRRYSILETAYLKQESKYAKMTNAELWDDLTKLDLELYRFRKLAQHESGKLRRLNRRYARAQRDWWYKRHSRMWALVQDATVDCLTDF